MARRSPFVEPVAVEPRVRGKIGDSKPYGIIDKQHLEAVYSIVGQETEAGAVCSRRKSQLWSRKYCAHRHSSERKFGRTVCK